MFHHDTIHLVNIRKQTRVMFDDIGMAEMKVANIQIHSCVSLSMYAIASR